MDCLIICGRTRKIWINGKIIITPPYYCMKGISSAFLRYKGVVVYGNGGGNFHYCKVRCKVLYYS